MIATEHIKIGSNYYEKVKAFKYLGSLLTNQNYSDCNILEWLSIKIRN